MFSHLKLVRQNSQSINFILVDTYMNKITPELQKYFVCFCELDFSNKAETLLVDQTVQPFMHVNMLLAFIAVAMWCV